MQIFIFGVLFAIFIVPLVEGIRDLILTMIENLKSRMAIRIYKNNQIINAPKEDTHVIGFVAPDEEWEEEDDD